MENNIIHSAEEVKAHLKENPDEGRKHLQQMAIKYGITPKLKHSALLLNLDYTKTSEEAKKEALRLEMLKLVDQLVSDYKENAKKEEFQKLQKARQRLANGLLEKPLPNAMVFTCRGIKKTFKKSNFTLGPIKLTLRQGEITGVVGENGNGKTTLFRIVAGELKEDTGDLSYPFLQKDISKGLDWVNIKNQISYVPQELPRWYGSLKDNIKYEAALHGILGPKNEEETQFIIQRLGLEEHLGKTWSELSGGFKLRFSLARAMVWKPKLLIIDEPLANLDVKTQLVILKDLQDMARSLRYPMAMMISSQHLHEIEAISDKILFLKNGSVSFYDFTENLGNARHANTFELDCEENLKAIKQIMSEIPNSKVYYNGIHFVINTPLHITYKELLLHLLKKEVGIEYFRDTSRSVKGLFDLE